MSANILDDAQQNATGSTSLPKPLKLKASVDSAKAKAKAEARMDQAADSVVTAPQKDLGRYCIVLASRITQRNADAFVSELHKEGWKDADVYINNDIVRVVYGHFQTSRMHTTHCATSGTTNISNRLGFIKSDEESKVPQM